MYSCDICTYITNDQSNYNKHLLTKRHKTKYNKFITNTSQIIGNNEIQSQMI